MSSEPFLEAFGGSFVTLLGSIWTHFWLFRGGFLHCFLLFGVGFLDLLQKAPVVVALHRSHSQLRLFAFQPNVSDDMGNDLDCQDLLFLKMGYMSY